MRLWLTVFLLLPGIAMASEEPLVIAWDPERVAVVQGRWLESFSRDAHALTLPLLTLHAAAAREAGLESTGDYLDAVVEVARGGDPAKAEEAWKKSARAPVIVIVKLNAARDAAESVLAGVRAPDDAWLERAERGLAAFSRSLPGFRDSWERRGPAVEYVIADLVLRRGTGEQTAPSGTYPPLDPSLRPAVGRSYVFWRNTMRAKWYEREIVPSVRPVLHRSVLAQLSADAHLRFYATRFLMYEVGPTHVEGQDLAAMLGETRNPLIILKADILPALYHRGASDLAALTAMTLYALNDALSGDAPPAHKPASATILNWVRERGGLKGAAGGWRIDEGKMSAALRALAGEILEIESAGDRARAERLFARYGQITPEIEETLSRMPRIQARPRIHYEILE